MALYEPDAVLAFPAGQLTSGARAIREVFVDMLARDITFGGETRPAIHNGDLALTSTRLPGGGATVEIARRQPDGSWRWLIDQPSVLT